MIQSIGNFRDRFYRRLAASPAFGGTLTSKGEFRPLDPPLYVFFFGGGGFFKRKLSKITHPTTLLITKFAVELIVLELFYNFH